MPQTYVHIYRLVMGNYASYQIWVLSAQPGVSDRVGRKILYTILCLDVLLSLLNVYWFHQMIASIRKRFNVTIKSPITAKKAKYS